MADMSQSSLRRLFKEHTGKSSQDFVKDLRMMTAARQLLTSDKRVSAIAYKIGYDDFNYFSRTFKAVFGLSPQEYRRVSREQGVPLTKNTPIAAADQFVVEHPGVKINIETFSWGDFYTKWTTGLASGNVEGARVVAVLDPEHGEAVAQELNCDAETELERLCARPEVDAVLVVSPTISTRSRSSARCATKRTCFVKKPSPSTTPTVMRW